MGTNNLTTKNPGDVISSTDPNQYKTAVTVDLVPRNISGVPTDIAGGLGSTLYRWLAGYIKTLYFGASASNLSIEEGTGADAGNIWFKRAGTLKSRITAAGFDGAYIGTNSIAEASLTFTRKWRTKQITASGAGTISIPSDVSFVWILAWGGGGGGAGSSGSGGSTGGGGGAAGCMASVYRPVTPGGTLTYSVGAATGNAAAGAAGATGNATTIAGVITVPGGGGGVQYASGGAGGATASGPFYFRAANGGGFGVAGEASAFQGAAAAGGGGQGGGGGAGYGAGGVGVGANDTGGAGDQGGGGGGAGNGASGLGGAGGAGTIIFIAVTTDATWS